MRLLPRLAALASVVSVLAVGLVVAPQAASAPADAAGTLCAVANGAYPNLNVAPHSRYDAGVNAYVGADFLASTGASEGEGVFIVGGSASFDTPYFNLGVAGIGSRVAPPPMSDMLVAGTGVTVASGILDVGFRIGGNVVSGGAVSPIASVVTSGGTVTENAPASLTPYATTPTDYQELSALYAGLPATGLVTVTPYSVTFRGDGSATRQVFTVAGSDLGSIGATKSMMFDDIPLGTVVVVNVTGSTAAVSANRFFRDSVDVDPFSTTDLDFSTLTQSLMWNFPDATTVTLGDGDQLLGSVMVPRAGSSTTLLTSTNGRFYTAGSLSFGGSTQTGLEMHNYPFAERACATVATGSLSVTKTVSDPDAVVDPARVFTGGYECRDTVGALVLSGSWSLAAGSSLVTAPLPAGSRCAVTEDGLAAPTAADASYRWAAPAITPATVVIAAGPAASSVTVHNEVRRALGDLEMTKLLDDPYGVVDASRVYTGTFECSLDGTAMTPRPGTWSTTAGAAPLRLATGLPAGTVCSLAEDALVEPPLPGYPQYVWAAPVVAPATVTIVENAATRITVTNIVEDPTTAVAMPSAAEPTDAAATAPVVTPHARAALARTGLDATPLLAAAGILLVLGLVLSVTQRLARRRRSLRDKPPTRSV